MITPRATNPGTPSCTTKTAAWEPANELKHLALIVTKYHVPELLPEENITMFLERVLKERRDAKQWLNN